MSTTPYSVEFTAMKHGTREEYLKLQEIETVYAAAAAERILTALRRQHGETMAGYKISRAEHALQTASRAWFEGADLDWVVGALLHDIGDELAPQNHGEMAAAVVRPFLRDEVTWCVEKHGAFQRVYFAHFLGGDPETRQLFKDHPHYQACVEFCEFWDQASFDPGYDSLPLEFFEPLLRQVLGRPAYAGDVLRIGEHCPLRDPSVAAERKGEVAAKMRAGGAI